MLLSSSPGDGANVALLAREGLPRCCKGATACRQHYVNEIAFSVDAAAPGDAIEQAAKEHGALPGMAVTVGPTMQLGPFLERGNDSKDSYQYQAILMATVRSAVR